MGMCRTLFPMIACCRSSKHFVGRRSGCRSALEDGLAAGEPALLPPLSESAPGSAVVSRRSGSLLTRPRRRGVH